MCIRDRNKSASVNGLKRLAKMMCSSSGSYEKKKKKKNNERIGGIVRLIKGASLDGTKTTNKKKRASDGIDALRATASLSVSLFDEDDSDEDDDCDTNFPDSAPRPHTTNTRVEVFGIVRYLS